jgi:branched-chain amino acid aminotransferase
LNSYINFNGSLFQSGSAIIAADSRALKYGDGLFETMRIAEYQIHLLDHHFQRLFESMEILHFDIPDSFNSVDLATQILNVCEKNNLPNARVRLNVFRGVGGLTDQNNLPNYIIQAEETKNKYYSLNEVGLAIDIFPDVKKSCDRLSNLKSNNFLPYSLAASYAKKNLLNDSLILNMHGRICESTISNIFLVKNKAIYTPALDEGCIAGVMRRFLLEKLSAKGIWVKETAVSIEEIETADEVFLSNSISGIRWVRQFHKVVYQNTFTTQVFYEIFSKDLNKNLTDLVV